MSQVTGVPDAIRRLSGGDARAAIAGHAGEVGISDVVWPADARLLCDAGERSSAPSVAQALHVINGDTLNKKLMAPDAYPGSGHQAGALGFQDSGSSVSLGIQPLSDGRARSSRCWTRCGRRSTAAGFGRCAARGAPAGARRYDVGHADEQGIPVQLLMRRILSCGIGILACCALRGHAPVVRQGCRARSSPRIAPAATERMSAWAA